MKRPAAERPILLSAIAFLLLLSGGSGGSAQDIEAGLRLARAWCTGCHLVEAGGATSDVAPSFPLIARNPEMTDERLRGWLVAPHPPMPDLRLSETEISDLVAYISTLRTE